MRPVRVPFTWIAQGRNGAKESGSSEKIQWVEPKLVCEVAFAEWTEDEELRQTTSPRRPDDKTPEKVVV
jgi:ATP-dependent DNA ligase